MRPIADCSSARVRPRASPYSTRARVTGAPPCPASWTRTTCITTPRASAYMWLGEKDSSACFSKRTRTTTSFSRSFRLPWGLGRPDTSEKAGRPRIASSWRFPRALAVAPKCGFTRCRTKDKRPVRSSVLQTHKLAYALLSALGWAGTVSGQSETAIIQQTARVANAIRVDHAPKIDGTLDDPLWKLAEPITDRKSTRLNSSHGYISYAVFCLKKKYELLSRLHLVCRLLLEKKSRRILFLTARRSAVDRSTAWASMRKSRNCSSRSSITMMSDS